MFDIEIKIEKQICFGLIKTAKTVRRTVWESWKDVPVARRSALLAYCIQYPEAATLYALRDMLYLKTDFLSLDLFAPEDFGALIKRLSWLKLEESPDAIIPVFEYKNVKYELIKPNFENGTALEYALIDRFFSEYHENPTDELLLNLCAVVCRKINKKNISVSIKTADEVAAKSKQLEGLPIEYIVNVYTYVKGIRQQVYDTYGEHLFKTPLTDEEKAYLDKRGTEYEDDEGDPLGWYSLFMLMAEKPSNLKNIEQMNFHTLCLWRVKDLQQAAKNKPNGDTEF
jgi:transcriptional antiterminator